MKLCILMRGLLSCCAVAFASAAAPVITLDLSGRGVQLQKLQNSILRNHDLGLTQPNGAAVGSRQDYVQRCSAGRSTNAKNCALPNAKAFDHQEGSLKVNARIFLVDLVRGQLLKIFPSIVFFIVFLRTTKK